MAEVVSNGAHGNLDSVMQVLRNDMLAGEEDAGAFLETLSNQSIRDCTSIDDIIRAIQNLNASRLRILRKIAEEAFLRWSAIFDEGQVLASEGDDVSVIVDRALRPNEPERLRLFRDAFPPGDLRKASANFARYVRDQCGGLCPSETTFGDRSTFQKLMRQLGGRDRVKAWSAAHEDAVAAAALMYLVDAGANIAVALSLPPKFEESTDEPGHVKIVGQKNTANYKPIVEDLPIDDPGVAISTVQALRKLRCMTEPFRCQNPSLAGALFIHRFFPTPAKAKSSFIRQRMTYLLRSHPELRDVPLRPSHIRSSVLLDATLNLEGSIVAARAIADHDGDGVTEGYTMKWPTRLIYLKMIREFQESMQILLIYDIPGAVEGLGIEPEQAEKLYEKAVRTGLGFSCRDPRAGANPRSKPGETCTRIEDCIDCRMILFLATVENVADIILLQRHLLAHQDEWQAQREERWNRVWLPYLALSIVILEKIRRSPYACIIPAGQKLAAEWSSTGYGLAPLF
ncbi:hypothetical protein [Microvirga massiliensis]|uniref:hypothetical protein n=1 Tax=Microvirga massiliensis TaxID=1033741 RepID=UPI0011C72870|nr:hypothetical protein [Microvirga massiliensis]